MEQVEGASIAEAAAWYRLVGNGQLPVEVREHQVVDVRGLEERVPGVRGNETDAVAVAPDDGDRAFQSRRGCSDLKRLRQRMLRVLRTAADGRVDRNNDHVLALFVEMGKC